MSDAAGAGPPGRRWDERERRVSLVQVTQSWGMAPVTSPGCCKVLPGERGGHGTARLWGQRHGNNAAPALMWPPLNVPWGVTGWGHPCPLAA